LHAYNGESENSLCAGKMHPPKKLTGDDSKTYRKPSQKCNK